MVILDRGGGAGAPQPAETAAAPSAPGSRGERLVFGSRPRRGRGRRLGSGRRGNEGGGVGQPLLEVGPSLEPSPQETVASPAAARRTGRARVSRSRGTPGRSHTRAALSSVGYLSTSTVPQTPFLPQAVYVAARVRQHLVLVLRVVRAPARDARAEAAVGARSARGGRCRSRGRSRTARTRSAPGCLPGGRRRTSGRR